MAKIINVDLHTSKNFAYRVSTSRYNNVITNPYEVKATNK